MKKTLFITLILLTFMLVTGCDTKNETSDSDEGTNENSTDTFITCNSLDEFAQYSAKDTPCKLIFENNPDYFIHSDLIYDGKQYYLTDKADVKYKYLLDIRSTDGTNAFGRTRIIAISNTYCNDMDEYILYLHATKAVEENGTIYYEGTDYWIDFARDVYYEYKE